MTMFSLFQKKKPRRVSADIVRPLRREDGVLVSSSDPYERLLALIVFGIGVVAIASDPGQQLGRFLGLTVLVFGTVFLAGRYFLKFQAQMVGELQRLVSILGIALLVLLVARITRDSEGLTPLWIPMPFVSMIFAVLLSPRFAIEAAVMLLTLCALVLWGVDDLFPMLLTLFAGSATGALYSFRVRRPSRLIAVGVLVGTTQALLRAALALFRDEIPSTLELAGTLGLAMALGLASGLLVVGLLPLFERALNRLSDVTLLDYSNQNEQPLLRRLQMEAPGTHHHSFLVGTLAEKAAEAIGANGLLCRVGSYFHDIGKMNKPEYFSENSPDAKARHAELSPEMSKLIITAHAKDGAELADLYGVPGPIKAFIEEHHGTTAVEYFYRMAVRMRPDEDVSKDSYRYPGPRPRTKETAIAMIADSVEAASRTVKDPNPANLEKVIHDIIEMKIKDGQLDDCGLTMRDLTRIREALLHVQIGIYHRRPSYPKDPTGALTVPLAEAEFQPELETGRFDGDSRGEPPAR